MPAGNLPAIAVHRSCRPPMRRARPWRWARVRKRARGSRLLSRQRCLKQCPATRVPRGGDGAQTAPWPSCR